MTGITIRRNDAGASSTMNIDESTDTASASTTATLVVSSVP